MQQEPNTVHMRLYTPSGVPLNFVLSIRDGKLTETLPDVAAMETMIAASGYLVNAPGLEVGEELETITHVVRRTQHNQDGSQTPCLGLYFENPKLVFCKKAYLNTAEDIATFERLSGLKLAQLPEFPSTALPKRDEKSAVQFIVAAKTPFQVRMAQGTYTDEQTGEVKSTPKFAGFYEVSKPAPAQTTPPASGNTGQSGTGNGGSKAIAAPDVNTWKKWVFDATKFMYTDDDKYVKERHSASLAKRMEDTSEFGINPTMTLDIVIQVVMRYRALTDMFIESADYGNIFGEPGFNGYFDAYGAMNTWKRFNEYYVANMPQAKAKHTS